MEYVNLRLSLGDAIILFSIPKSLDGQISMYSQMNKTLVNEVTNVLVDNNLRHKGVSYGSEKETKT